MTEHVLPGDIEKRSFEIIAEELGSMGISLDPEQDPVIRRAIHTSADFDYARTLHFTEDAVNIARNLIAEGADIITDTNTKVMPWLRANGSMVDMMLNDEEK